MYLFFCGVRVLIQKSQPFCDTISKSISIDNASFPAIVSSWGVLQRKVLKQQGHHWGVKCVAFSPGSVTLKRGKAGGREGFAARRLLSGFC